MNNALLIHGSCDRKEYFDDKFPSLSNNHWLPWLQKQLLIKDIFTQTPEMPEAYKPDYEKWRREFERFDINAETVLVGHSCGGGFLVRWLSENKVKVKKLMLVAPWLDPSRKRTTDFFDFSIDPGIRERIREIHILTSDNEDTEGVKRSVERIRAALPGAEFHQIPNMGHFTYDEMKTDKFPQLLELILK